MSNDSPQSDPLSTDLKALEDALKVQSQTTFRAADVENARRRQLSDDLLQLERPHVRHELRRALRRLKAKLLKKL
ncbi:MAG: hypothetical protein D6722_00770 [Bacteroidetes bacterium]|nr:MAG: hypothetical protein D6722_00770 [Bacteroidota bacterium]